MAAISLEWQNRFNQHWLHDHINDPYVKMAQREGYRARAAYKLKEIDEQDKLIRPGQVIVDLGATPGSWSQYARNKLAQGKKRDAEREGGIDGTIVALDILPMEPIADVHFLQGDFREDEVLHQLEEVLEGRAVDLVISDMAPTSLAWPRQTRRASSICAIWRSNLRRII